MIEGNISWYRAASWTGFALTVILYLIIAKPERKTLHYTLLYIFFIFLMGILGGRAVQYLVSHKFTLSGFFRSLSTGDTTVLGAILFGGITAGLLSRGSRGYISVDALVAVFPFGHGIGRIGCFEAGCCFGKLCAPGPLSVTYDDSWIYSGILPSGPRLPVQLVSTVFLFCLGTVLIFVYLKQKRKGVTAGWYLFLYGIFRFFIEFLRDDAVRGRLGLLWTGQYFGIAFVLLGGALIILSRRKNRSL